MALEEIRNERIKKVLKLKGYEIDPYPGDTNRKFLIAEIIEKFPALIKSKKEITVSGRIVARREHGGSMFLDIKDATGKVQLYFKEDILGEKSYNIFQETIDIGDFIEVKGKPFLTKKGEKTVLTGLWRMLAKSLRPLPEKWHGLQDVEERFRKRYLDLLMNEEVRGRFLMRTKIISALREILDKDNFQEVETPMLHVLPGGALARPFKTHHNALDIDLYLRIAPELYLKRLLVGGMERVYEIGRNFRNEGIDATHNPEFTMLECYAAYWDEEKMMMFVERLLVGLLKILKKKTEINFDGKKIKIKSPFSRISFKEVLKRYALIVDYNKETRDSLVTRAKQFGVEVSGYAEKGKIADEIYKKICRPHLINPTFVTNHPLDISPLAKKTSKDPSETRRFQLIVAGLEMVNGFSELNDPLDQRVRFEAQEKEGARGEEEAHRLDEDFLEALEYGMPPAAGFGIGIDRLVMLLTDTKNVREVVLFPTMRLK